MLEINVNVNSPDIVQALRLLVNAIQPTSAATPAKEENVPAGIQAPAPAPVTTVPPPAPVTTAPAYTTAQVATAGAALMQSNPALQPALMELVHRYGAQTVQDIPQDKLGAFATELRQMGAKI